ncbi:hypothetical protein EJ070_29355 [Mesorhizobium sp. M1E.F.Ca.ET.045.02.1.1]|uniref:hypothetical protein n=1 Tax=unclassified Mesorhizobium TaxID=325217 RepID=UPI000F76463A|nr:MULTISPECIES: hypothetical protein [unclassified Mesorhizobium]AZO24393.1 hypothetical protein EJ070_29355 [Mesorhizobium sp. M1E.F.Ca.ET.045.02.1.1]RUW80855.1 hypothetical protein EOA29_21655 [Mesorhizobium sp. M1E.F.Ca.ET.063.01.1.1]RWD82346.1 MAG: hypothetical protein EOS38_27045 [Mesorhizobium sp.]TKB08901.1 MAG: hypothetical protein E5V75_31620 [Mesorhizobium sp.]
MGRKPRVDKASEYEFATICANAGVYPQVVNEDETGWDCLVEFPPDPNFVPAEAQPAGLSAYAQIKSTIGRYRSTSITLSNARRMAQQGHPWFIVLFHRPASGERRIYARHIWGDLITESLKAIRLADLAGEKLHKRTLAISFDGSDDHTEDLVQWIEQTIIAVGVDYQSKKLNIFRSVGYEEGHASIKFSFQVENADEVAKVFLGIGEVQIQNFEFVPKRFGLPDKRGQLLAGTATLTASPATWYSCQIRIRAKNKDTPIVIPGKAAFTTFPRGYARFSSEFLDLVWSTSDNGVQFNSKITIEERRSLGALVAHVRLLTLVTSSDTDMQIWAGGRRIYGGRARKAADGRWHQLYPVLEFLRSLSTDDVELSIADVVRASAELGRFQEIAAVRGVACTLEFTDVERVPVGAERLLYSAQVTVGSATFFAIVERPVIREDATGPQKHFALGDPRIIESYAATGDGLEQQFQADFEREINQSFLTLGVADIRPAFEGHEIRIYGSPGFDRLDAINS